MPQNPRNERPASSNRRAFMQSTAIAAGGLAAGLGIHSSAHAAGSDILRIGLIGCGGRGTGAAAQALKADPNTRLVAMGDAFADQIDQSMKGLMKQSVGNQIDVDDDHRFVGFDAYQQVIDAVDVVLLATPPHFRPQHMAASVAAGKHTFAEKPVAVDGAGVRSVLETAKKAKEKGVSLVSGLCWRYETGMKETIARIHDGAVGEIAAMETTRFGGDVGRALVRDPKMSDMEYQMRNWYYYAWLSGDFNVEQFVHELDKMAWAMGDKYPTSCYSTGGRQTRIAPENGNIFDHIYTVYEYDNGVKLYASTRQQDGCSNVRLDQVFGRKGNANLMKYTITGAEEWRWDGRMTVMHQLEQDAFLASIRSGKLINNGDYMAHSTLMGIMARMSAYTGRTVTWDEALNSKERLGPDHYDWNMSLPEPAVALPGFTGLA